MTDSAMMEQHFQGKKHLKNVRNVDLRAQQEGKAVYVTKLGALQITDLHAYMSTFGAVVNLIPGKNRNNPNRLHHVIIEFESEEAVSKILSKDLRRNHKIQLPGSNPPKYQDIIVYERKFQEKTRSPTPPECPGVTHDQVTILELNIIKPINDWSMSVTAFRTLVKFNPQV